MSLGPEITDRRLRDRFYSSIVLYVALHVHACVRVSLTTCMAELRGGCGSMSNWQGVCPKLLIWDSTACDDDDKRKKKEIRQRYVRKCNHNKTYWWYKFRRGKICWYSTVHTKKQTSKCFTDTHLKKELKTPLTMSIIVFNKHVRSINSDNKKRSYKIRN